MDATKLEIRWRCRPGCKLTPRPEGAIELVVDGADPVAIAMRPGLAQHVAGLNRGLSDLQIAGATGGNYALSAVMFGFVSRLRARGLLVADLYGPERRLATVRPLAPDFEVVLHAAQPADGARRWCLSRFALLRREGRQWLLEATDAPCEVLIDEPAVIGWLTEAAVRPPAPESLPFQVVRLLARLGFLDDAGEPEPVERRTWELHDRLLHTRSRAFGSLRAFGGTYRFRGQGAGADGPLPAEPAALREPYAGATVELPAPDTGASRPLAEVMERRRSLRSMGDPPVSLAQVGALLYRVARVTQRLPGDYALRPYPSAGALHELEFYLAVRTCRGLDPGFHHYRGDVHCLTRLAGDAVERASAAMIADCAAAWAQPEQPPQCLIVVASRVPRLAWKYEAIAYRLSLLGAGVALQCLYLVATDLGLNGCAAGTGNPALFAEATGASSWTETSIAEFGFGSGREHA